MIVLFIFITFCLDYVLNMQRNLMIGLDRAYELSWICADYFMEQNVGSVLNIIRVIIMSSLTIVWRGINVLGISQLKTLSSFRSNRKEYELTKDLIW